MTNALTLLKEDHKRVKALLEELAEAGDRAPRKREALLRQIALELTTHTTLEEEIFYPAFLAAAKKRDDQTVYYEAQEEHLAAKVVLADLLRADPTTPSFHGKAKVLKELVLHHAKEEESEMFPLARSLMGKEELDALGESMARRKSALLSKQQNGAARSRSVGASA
jgi:hemerythrin superfamily protein